MFDPFLHWTLRRIYLLLLCLLCNIAHAGMLDDSVERGGEPWCYLAKSTTVIGVPDQPDVTQITYDGAVYTKSAELCFFYGADRKPLLARGKTFSQGWMPIVNYDWDAGPIHYAIEYFAAPLVDETVENTVNFVHVSMTNRSGTPQNGIFTAALRHTAGDYRFGSTKFDPKWKYEVTRGSVYRDGKCVFKFAPLNADIEAVPGEPYQESFIGADKAVTPRAECCLETFRRTLEPGEVFEMTFSMPRVPVPVTNDGYLKKLGDAQYADYRNRTVAFWTDLAGKNTFEIPEKRVQDAQHASLIHVMLATRSRDSDWIQTDGLPYSDFFLTSMPQMVLTYLQNGRTDWAEHLVLRGISYQLANGLYQDRALAHGKEIPAAHGHVMYSASLTALYSQDKTFAEQIYPSLTRAVNYIDQSMRTDQFGLLPPAYPYDNEMIDGHYTSNNTWALLGLRCAVRVARFLNHDDDAKAWGKLAAQFESNILKGIADSVKPDGYVPPGLYPYKTGEAARKGFAFYTTDSDWENMLLAFPSELLSPDDPHVRQTVDHIRVGYAEGIMTYRHGMHLHQYITANQVEQYLVMGDNFTALKNYYHILLHTGSTSEGFENLVKPWTDREVEASCPSPHAWASAKIACLTRDLILLEYGGQCGMIPNQRELWLFHCLSPAWVQPTGSIAMNDAPTEFGPITARMRFTVDGASVSIKTDFHDQPKCFRLRLPYFKELVSFKTNAKTFSTEGDCIVISPDATEVSLFWRDKPGANLHTIENILTDYRSADSFKGADPKGYAIIEHHKPFLTDSEKSNEPQPLSFDLVKNTFLLEYHRRAQEFISTGGELTKIQAPAILSAQQRKTAFARLYEHVP